MQNKLYSILACFTLLILVACGSSGTGAEPTPNSTAIIETAIANANATMTAMAVVQPSPLPSDTPIPTAAITDTPSLTPLPLETATLPGVRVSVSEDTNCRTGPGTIYDRVGGLKVGQSAEVVGRDQATQHLYIRLPDNPVVFCWIISYYANVTGNVATIPVMTPPPTPTATITTTPGKTTTPSMDFSVSFLGADSCVAWFLEFNIVNTGAIVIESVKVVAKDLTTPNTFTASYDKFEDWNGCTVGAVQMDLVTGESEKTNSGANITYNPAGHSFEASITVCSQNGLAGSCLTKTINFIP